MIVSLDQNCPWPRLLNEGVGGKFDFLCLHKTLCFCLQQDGLFACVNVLDGHIYDTGPPRLTHTLASSHMMPRSPIIAELRVIRVS